MSDPMTPAVPDPKVEAHNLAEQVIDREGNAWRIVRDGGMATRAVYQGAISIGIAALERDYGPLIPLAARAAAPDALTAVCSQCGERSSAMVKIGTSDGWCTACLDEDAEPAPDALRTAWDEGYEAAETMARCWGHTDHWEDEPENPHQGGQL